MTFPYPPAAFIRLVIRLFLVAALSIAGVAAHAQSTMVLAAASLKDAMDAAVSQYQKQTGEKIVVSYASSSTLAKQIENGAPADIFISADLDWMDYVDKRNLVRTGMRINWLRNELVLVAPAKSTVTVEIKAGFPLAQLLGNQRLAMGDPDYVPAGKYGKAALESLGVWTSVSDRIARAEDVRVALAYVSRGETPLGIVYRTDTLADSNVRIVATFPENTHPPIIYPMAMTTAGKSPTAGKFYEFLKSAAASEIVRGQGFIRY